MANQAQGNSSPLRYVEQWYPVFAAHGVDERYYEKWFSNYDTPTKAHEELLAKVKAKYKENAPMVFLGKFGGGKTHLAMAMVKHHLMTRRHAFYYTMSDMFRDYRVSLRSEEFTERHFFNRVFNCDLLIIDELNIRSDSEAENRILQEIIDKRYAGLRATIFIANMDEAGFAEVITERLLSRLREQGTELITFNFEDYRSKK